MSLATTRRLVVVRPSSGLLLVGTIAAIALFGSLAQLAHGGLGPMRPGSVLARSSPSTGDLDPAGVLLAAATTLPLLAWRRSPLGVFVATTAASILMVGLDYPVDLMLGPAAALFLLAAGHPWSRPASALVGGMFLAYLAAATAAQDTFPGSELLHSGLIWAVAWFAGERTRLRREHIASLEERAVRTERDRERERLLAAAEERARIARDLHDSAGHAINVIAVRAGAARLRHDEDPHRSLAALATIEDLARQTAADIDQIVRALRDGDADGPPGFAALDALVERHMAAGLDVTLEISGPPRLLGGPSDQAAYRILQEALTNAARHGAGSAHIEVAFGTDAVDLAVTNPVPADGTSRPGGGHGLIGMRERASLLGGNVAAARANGSFRVDARIPYEADRP